MNSEFFTGSNPSLINTKIINEINNELELKGDNNFKEKATISNFYNNYISNNSFALFVFSIIGIYLFIKYQLKLDKDAKLLQEEKELSEFKKNLKENTNYLVNNYNKINYSNIDNNIIDDEYSLETLTENNLESNYLNNNVTDFINSTNSNIGISDRENKNNIHNIAKKIFSN